MWLFDTSVGGTCDVVAKAQLTERVRIRQPEADRLIAAHAVALGRTLVTNNERHFRGIQGLIVENWSQ